MQKEVVDLEQASVTSMLDYLRDEEPSTTRIEKARLSLGAFSNIQRLKSAENARWALEMMAERSGFPVPERMAMIASGSSDGTE